MVILTDPGPDGLFDDDVVNADGSVSYGANGVPNTYDDVTRMRMTNSSGQFTFTGLSVPAGRTTQQYHITSIATGWFQTLPNPSTMTTAQLANNTTLTGVVFGWKSTP
jgi:hypothetical protein